MTMMRQTMNEKDEEARNRLSMMDARVVELETLKLTPGGWREFDLVRERFSKTFKTNKKEIRGIFNQERLHLVVGSHIQQLYD